MTLSYVSKCIQLFNKYMLTIGLDKLSQKAMVLPPSPGRDANVLFFDSHFLYFKVITSPYFDTLILGTDGMLY